MSVKRNLWDTFQGDGAIEIQWAITRYLIQGGRGGSFCARARGGGDVKEKVWSIFHGDRGGD